MKILYSFAKSGFEADYWTREVAAASNGTTCFVPFNHGRYLNPYSYVRAQLLDNLYFANNRSLLQMYADIQEKIRAERADALLVDTYSPYHPEFLLNLDVYKVLRTTDGPLAAYDRDFAYLHAFDHILYHSPAYSRDMTMSRKLEYCGAKRFDFWPLGSFDALCNRARTEAEIAAAPRDIDVVFVGALHVNKMPLLATVKKALGRRLRLFGIANLKKNLYFNLMYGLPGWVRPLPFEGYVPLYQRAKIGINVHNRGDYTVGGYRLFDLPANGVMQISDGGPYLQSFFQPGREIVGYSDARDLIDKVRYYLTHDEERQQIALGGFRRVQRDYRISTLLHRAAELLARGMGTPA